MAFMVPKDIFGEVAMQNATSADKLKQEVIINYFGNAQKAVSPEPLNPQAIP